MLELATVHRLTAGSGDYDVRGLLDAGLYYGSIRVILDDFDLLELIDKIGIENLIILASSNTYSVEIVNGFYGTTGMVDDRRRKVFLPQQAHIDATRDPLAARDPASVLHRHLNIPGKESRGSVGDVDRLLARAELTNYPKLLGSEYETNDLWISLVQDQDVLREAISLSARALGFEVEQDLLRTAKLNSFKSKNAATFWSDIDLEEIVPPIGERRFLIDNAFGAIAQYRTDLILSERLGGDYISTQSESQFAANRVNAALSRAVEAREQVDCFHRIAFDGGPSVGAAFADGKLSFGEALKIVEEASRFKKWIHGLPAESDLAAEYCRKISEAPLLDRFPGREIRLLTMTGIGAGVGALVAGPAGALAGLGLGVFDEYLVGRLVKGWRPHEFIARLQKKLR